MRFSIKGLRREEALRKWDVGHLVKRPVRVPWSIRLNSISLYIEGMPLPERSEIDFSRYPGSQVSILKIKKEEAEPGLMIRASYDIVAQVQSEGEG